MIATLKSCAVALPSQRNCATLENSATATATNYIKTGRQPASIKELRTQLKAQHYRNQAATVSATEPPKVAHEVASKSVSCDLVREFMEVDGLTLEEAQAFAAVSVAPRPAAEWLAMIAELDALIAEYCKAFRLSQEAQARIADVRNRQSVMTILGTLNWFRRELAPPNR